MTMIITVPKKLFLRWGFLYRLNYSNTKTLIDQQCLWILEEHSINAQDYKFMLHCAKSLSALG